MPLLSVTTNRPLPDERRPTALKDLSARIADALGKPESYVMVAYQHNPDMLFAGTDAPLAYVELKSIGLPDEHTSTLSAVVAQAVDELLGIPADRVYVEFASAQRHLWGWNGGTF